MELSPSLMQNTLQIFYLVCCLSFNLVLVFCFVLATQSFYVVELNFLFNISSLGFVLYLESPFFFLLQNYNNNYLVFSFHASMAFF